MAILGFICLVLLALWTTALAVGGMLASMSFGGKFEPALLVSAVLAAALWYVAWRFSPFTITLAS